MPEYGTFHGYGSFARFTLYTDAERQAGDLVPMYEVGEPEEAWTLQGVRWLVVGFVMTCVYSGLVVGSVLLGFEVLGRARG